MGKLKPFGEENPVALFLTTNVFKKGPAQKVNNGYSLWVSSGEYVLEAVIYDKDILEIINYAETFDIVYSIDKNRYHNTPKLIIRDTRLS